MGSVVFVGNVAHECVSEDALVHLKTYKYSSVDKSLISRYILRHYVCEDPSPLFKQLTDRAVGGLRRTPAAMARTKHGHPLGVLLHISECWPSGDIHS